MEIAYLDEHYSTGQLVCDIPTTPRSSFSGNSGSKFSFARGSHQDGIPWEAEQPAVAIQKCYFDTDDERWS